eukprot:359879-Chlamydomonas_euryale.AAC.2
MRTRNTTHSGTNHVRESRPRAPRMRRGASGTTELQPRPSSLESSSSKKKVTSRCLETYYPPKPNHACMSRHARAPGTAPGKSRSILLHKGTQETHAVRICANSALSSSAGAPPAASRRRTDMSCVSLRTRRYVLGRCAM